MSLTKESIEKKVEEMERREKNQREERERNLASPSEDSRKFNKAIADAALDTAGYRKSLRDPADPSLAANAQEAFSLMSCPMLSIHWDCNWVERGKKLTHPFYERGKEPQCINGGFVRCVSWLRHIKFIIAKRARERGKEKRTKKEKVGRKIR